MEFGPLNRKCCCIQASSILESLWLPHINSSWPENGWLEGSDPSLSGGPAIFSFRKGIFLATWNSGAPGSSTSVQGHSSPGKVSSKWSEVQFFAGNKLKLQWIGTSWWQSSSKSFSRWCFQIFFIFTPIWGRLSFWLIFFRWVETTNQFYTL